MPEGQPSLQTRFNVDECWGTAINRFCAQAVLGMPITPYGKGEQTRGFLPLEDSIQCLKLIIENPPKAGEYRVINQFDRSYSINELASEVAAAAVAEGLEPRIEHVKNPRVEAEEHFYEPDRDKLKALGYEPHGDMPGTLKSIIRDLIASRTRLEAFREHIKPKTWWR